MYRFYYLHWSRDLVSPVCRIFSKYFLKSVYNKSLYLVLKEYINRACMYSEMVKHLCQFHQYTYVYISALHSN